MTPLQPLSLFDDLTPHGYCLLWDPVLIWSHLLSDLAIAGAYLSIPAALMIVGQRRPDLNPAGVFYFFAAFIVLCAVTHIFGALTLWFPLYSAEGVAKVVTAVVSIGTSIIVWRLLESILNAPTHAALRQAHDKLASANIELEARVERRTAELKLANDQLAVAAAKAKDAEQVKTQFLAQMSHELRTPLNSVIGFTDLLSMEAAGPINETQKEYLKNVRSASTLLLQQVNDVLDLERLVHHGVVFSPQPISLQATIIDICQLLSPMADDMEVDISAQFGNAPSLCSDERALQSILTNLLSNAIKYSRKGGSVLVDVHAKDQAVEVVVRDQGIGIPEDKLDQIFQPFFRAHEHDLPAVAGTGLGLTLVKQLVEALGGTIRLDSVEGQGTTVTVTLPDHPPVPDSAPN